MRVDLVPETGYSRKHGLAWTQHIPHLALQFRMKYSNFTANTKHRGAIIALVGQLVHTNGKRLKVAFGGREEEMAVLGEHPFVWSPSLWMHQ